MSNPNVNVEDDCQILEQHNSKASIKIEEGSEPQLKRAKTQTSNAWKYFEKISFTTDGKEKCKCNGCGKEYTCSSKGGTSHLHRHISKCVKIPRLDDVGNMMLDYTTKMRSRKLDQKVVRELTAQMIILHDLPFQSVEWVGFRALCQYLSFGENTVISRNTITADVMKIYLLEKEKLKNQLARINGRVCLTSDCWTSCNTRGYITLTVHFIDENWKLNSKLLNFCHLEPPHTGHELSRKVFEFLKEWGIEKKVFSITLDNASSNDSMQNILKSQLCLSNNLLCNGDFFHIRCCAHILNLIVQEGLKMVSNALHKIRENVKYVRGSESRTKQFLQCVKEVGGIDSSVGLRLDVSTRWNSTYLMLESAIKYRSVFTSLGWNDVNYKHCPSNEDWERGKKMCEVLEPFYEITNMISGSTYPTSNLYFMQIWKIEVLLKNNVLSEDHVIKDMASQMMAKFDKYWNEYSTILAFGCVLDPRMKFQFLRYAYSRLYYNKFIVDEKLSNVKKALYALFNYYVNKSAPPSSIMDASTSTSTYERRVKTSLPTDYDDFEQEENKESLLVGKFELDLYLEEAKLVGHKDLDVLEYWRDRSLRFGDLGRMASDILSIPITTVASESAFSIGGRILNKYRSCMLSKNLEALICTRNWLLGFSLNDGSSSFGDVHEEATKVNENDKGLNVIISDEEEDID